MSHAGRFLAVISLFDVTYVDPKDNPRSKSQLGTEGRGPLTAAWRRR
jgi:hypothetical protein